MDRKTVCFSYQTNLEPPTKERIKQTFEKYPKLKFGFSPLTGIVVGLVMYGVDSSRIYDSIGYGVMSGLVILGVLSQFWKRKQED